MGQYSVSVLLAREPHGCYLIRSLILGNLPRVWSTDVPDVPDVLVPFHSDLARLHG